MSKPGIPTAPPSANVSDMLAILADPVQYRKHLEELKAQHKAIEERLGHYQTLEKIQAYHKQVKEDAAAVSQSRKDVEAALAKLEQASKDLTASKAEFAAVQSAHEQEYTARMAAMARDLSAHLGNVDAHEQAVAALAADRAALADKQAKHDARILKAKEKLAAVVQAIKGVEAL